MEWGVGVGIMVFRMAATFKNRLQIDSIYAASKLAIGFKRQQIGCKNAANRLQISSK